LDHEALYTLPGKNHFEVGKKVVKPSIALALSGTATKVIRFINHIVFFLLFLSKILTPFRFGYVRD
jgi:hypothetical protein